VKSAIKYFTTLAIYGLQNVQASSNGRASSINGFR